MLTDHAAPAYFDALCEVIDVRKAVQTPPEWQSFTESDLCTCCGRDVVWPHPAAATPSAAQRDRDKHHCRCCGKLVCQACSAHRKALPAIGLGLPARVCDRCVFGGKQSSDVKDERD